MTEKKEAPAAQKKLTPDWFVRGILAKIGDTFDQFMGRNWKPPSSLATSELVERLKRLLDAEVREDEGKGRFVPHNIKLKMQWDKFSTDAEEELKRLEYELLAAAIDHINDNRYHTYAPLKIEIKRDYFTEGVRLHAGFGEFAPEKDEPEVEMNVTMPQIKVGEFVPPEVVAEETEDFVAEFAVEGAPKTVELKFKKGDRLSVGRTKENALTIDDASISKHHATLMVNGEGILLVADTGSTNGTFINNERIAYGRAFAVGETDRLKFGHVEIFFRRLPKPTDFVAEEDETEAGTAASADAGLREETAAFETAPRQKQLGGGTPPPASAAGNLPTERLDINGDRRAEKIPAAAERPAYKTSQNEKRVTAQDIKEDAAAESGANGKSADGGAGADRAGNKI